MDISATTVMRNVRKNEWRMDIEERPEEQKIKSKYMIKKRKLYIFRLV